MQVVQQVVAVLAGHLITLLAFALGLTLGPGEVRRSVLRRVFWKGLALGFLGVPLLSALVVRVLGVPRGGQALLMLMAVCPGVALMVNTIRRRGGDLALGAALSLVMTVLAILLLPLTLAALDRGFGFAFHAPVGPLLRKVALPLLVATGVGLTIRRFRPRLAESLFPLSMGLFKAALAVILVVVAWKALPAFLRSPLTILATVVITLAGAALGHLLGAPREADRRTLAIVSAYGNPALVLTIVKLSHPDANALPAVGAYLIIRVAVLTAYLAWEGRSAARRLTSASSDGYPPHEPRTAR
jgi:BASS family bile acid:Na+ symporter